MNPCLQRESLLQALVDGELDAAIARYRQAIDLGERGPEMVRHAVQLLASRRRYDEAQEVLHKIGSGGDLGRLAVAVSLLNRDSQDVAGLVKSAAEAAKDSKNYHDFLWLGQVYETTGKGADRHVIGRHMAGHGHQGGH